jgi:hypothetical protein
MKRAITFALVVFAAASVTASAAPPAEEVVVNLIAGYCLSEKMGTPLPAGSIDPRKTGTRLTPSDRLARLSSKALRVATASGDVYYDYNETYCYAHASGVDRARTIVRLEDELKRLGLIFDRAPVKHTDGPTKDGRRLADLVIIVDTPASNPNALVIAVTYSDDPRVLSMGVAASRKQ